MNSSAYPLIIKLALLLSMWEWLHPAAVHAATATFEPTTITVGETTTLTLTAEGRITDVSLPTISGLKFSRQSQQSNYFMSSRSGSTSKVSHTLAFQVLGEKAGTYAIPTFDFKVDGKAYQVSGLTLNIEATKELTPEEISRTQPDFFMERKLSKQVAYVGEPIFETMQLHLKRPWQDLSRIGTDSPLLKVITVDETSSSQVEKYGLTYNLVQIFRILIPLKSTEIDPGPYGIQVSYLDANQRSQGYFSHFFRAVKTAKVMAPSRLLGINPLPQAGRPQDVSGFVGQAKLHTELTPRALAVGESSTLQLIFTAHGWLSSLQAPPPELGSAFQVYDDKPELQERILPQELSGTKIFRFFIIPLAAGTFDLGVYSWSFFNPQTKRYHTLTADLGTLTVAPGTTTQPPAATGRPPAEPAAATQAFTTTPLGTDITDIIRSWPPPAPPFHGRMRWLFTACWLIIILLSGALIHQSWRRRTHVLALADWQQQLLRVCQQQHSNALFELFVRFTAAQTQAKPAAITAYDIRRAAAAVGQPAPAAAAAIIDILDTASTRKSTAASPRQLAAVITTEQWQQLTRWIADWHVPKTENNRDRDSSATPHHV